MKLAIIKLSGKALQDIYSESGWVENIQHIQNQYDGIIIVHGAGKMITEWSDALGIPSNFYQGQRITTPQVMEVVSAVQSGLINGQLVAFLNTKNITAIGLTGSDRNLFIADRLNPELGLVGIPKVYHSHEWIFNLCHDSIVPVFSSVCRNAEGQLMNVNADIFTHVLATTLHAHSVFFISDINGVKIKDEVKSTLYPSQISDFILSGDIYGGMIPKSESAIELIHSGVSKVWIGSSNYQDFADAISGQQQKGTWFLPEPEVIHE